MARLPSGDGSSSTHWLSSVRFAGGLPFYSMGDEEITIKTGPFAGTKVKMAATDQVEAFSEIIEDIMGCVFGMDPGTYIITDMSSLEDFKGVRDLDVPAMKAILKEQYGIEFEETNLAYIARKIAGEF